MGHALHVAPARGAEAVEQKWVVERTMARRSGVLMWVHGL